MTRDGSPFSNIAEEDWVASNELAFAIRDAFPVAPGHTLVIPRRQIASWFETTNEERQALFELVDEAKSALDTEFTPDGYNIGINVGEAAGQTVFHLHVHIIPRYDGDMPDPRGGVRHVIPWKGNYKRSTAPALSTGGEDHFLKHIEPLLADSRRIDIVAAFVQASGLELLEERLHSALERGAHVRLLCGDYLNLTQERALRRMLDFLEVTSIETIEGLDGEFEARVVETGDWATTFHPKSWQFHIDTGGSSFVGSSNLSRLALTNGSEWNLRVDETRDLEAFRATNEAFEDHWRRARPLTAEWVEAYSERVSVDPRPLPPGEFDSGAIQTKPAQPHEMQRRALDALRQARQQGRDRALTVMATGLGKTWLSAFDVREFLDDGDDARVLFLAHRVEILRQAASTFRRIFPDASFGWFAADSSDLKADFVFASVQKLGRTEHLPKIEPGSFDYLIIDEVHHAAADGYRRIMDHLEPRFMLGLTATPDRADGQDILPLFDDYLAEEIGIAEGIESGWLVPFEYHGVKDTVDFEPIPWRSGKFDTRTLVTAVQTEARMERLETALEADPAARSIVFCCSIDHAIFVRDWLNERGRSAAAVVSNHPEADDRQRSLDRLAAGDLEFVCAVDILNEGVDIPAVDRVVMLRPTESNVVFLQQLGRGLRVHEGKKALHVVDFVGNHRIFLERLRWLLSIGMPDAPVSLQKFLEGSAVELPPGCSIELEFEAKELLRELIPRSSRNATIDAYREIRQGRDEPPTPAELFRLGHDPRKVRSKFGSWFGFVHDEGDTGLTNEEFAVIEDWLREIETTAMTKCYKMVALKVLLDRGGLSGGIAISDLARGSFDVIVRAPELFDDVRGVKMLGPNPREVDEATWELYWRKNPMSAWQNSDFFEVRDDRLAPKLPKAAMDRIETLQRFTRILIDYRLATYRARRRGTFDASVIRNNSGRPILMFGSRKGRSIPEGEVTVRVDNEEWTFRFVKIAVNVAYLGDDETNALAELLYRWFGSKAGEPGTRHRVRFERDGDAWLARPIGVPEFTTGEHRVAEFLDGDAYGESVLRDARLMLALHDSGYEATKLLGSVYPPSRLQSIERLITETVEAKPESKGR